MKHNFFEGPAQSRGPGRRSAGRSMAKRTSQAFNDRHIDRFATGGERSYFPRFTRPETRREAFAGTGLRSPGNETPSRTHRVKTA